MPGSRVPVAAQHLGRKARRSWAVLGCLQGFRKVDADRWEFSQEFFRKGRPDLLVQIQRRRAGTTHVAHSAAAQSAIEVPFPAADSRSGLAVPARPHEEHSPLHSQSAFQVLALIVIARSVLTRHCSGLLG